MTKQTRIKRSSRQRRVSQIVKRQGWQVHTPFTIWDTLAASPTQPMPESERTNWLMQAHLALEEMEKGADPHTSEWWSVAGAVNWMQALVEAGHLQDEQGLIADCHEALGRAGKRHLSKQRMGLDGEGMTALRQLLQDMDLALRELPHRVHIQAHIASAKRVAALVQGCKPQKGDMIVEVASA